MKQLYLALFFGLSFFCNSIAYAADANGVQAIQNLAIKLDTFKSSISQGFTVLSDRTIALETSVTSVANDVSLIQSSLQTFENQLNAMLSCNQDGKFYVSGVCKERKVLHAFARCTGGGPRGTCTPSCPAGYANIDTTMISSFEYWTYISLCTKEVLE